MSQPTAVDSAPTTTPTAVSVNVHLRPDTPVDAFDIGDRESERRSQSVSIHIGDRPGTLVLLGDSDNVERVLTAALMRVHEIRHERKLAATPSEQGPAQVAEARRIIGVSPAEDDARRADEDAKREAAGF